MPGYNKGKGTEEGGRQLYDACSFQSFRQIPSCLRSLVRTFQAVDLVGTPTLVNLGPLITAPAHALGSAANAWIEAVARIKVFVVIDQRRLRIVQMAEVVLGWELRATHVQQSPQLMFQFNSVVAFSHNVILMEDMTEKMSVIQRVQNRARYFVW